ncbi:sporulation integral membrane protein YlbJ [Ectobacillus ponti]|uniref:Sporulation integral membrane protein YlbJ n=1 Tax=Ectobacillus ponti TaxID=2961894 RepID=A0AA41XAR5_9BACI|nr:sporulation integral membrane protein YlbJ [Ectobacillus ponti]MCP8970263.1 sporulation integral membrane protein YlbJ [Ectobacillus ponti]
MRSKLKTMLLAFTATALTASLIINPQASLDASIRGLDMWWGVVFPSLLPFYIMAELLIGLGVVHFIGVLLEPLMRPLFRLPGVGGFVWAMGMASGFPSGAKLSARLRQEKYLSRVEAERLVSFTNSSNPLFIFGAVAVGFFHDPALGVILAASHYLSNFLVGLLMRFHGRKKDGSADKRPPSFSVKQAWHALHTKRLEEKRPLGKLIGDAITSSIQTLLMVGGFIILFSVLNKMLTVAHVTEAASSVIRHVLQMARLPESFSIPVFSGMFEITLGSQLTSQAASGSLLQQAMVVSLILGFSGFSVQAQVASILADTDIRFRPYFIARIMQSILAPACTFLLWKPLYENTQTLHPGSGVPVFLPQPALSDGWQAINAYGPLFTLICLYLYLFLLLHKASKR